MTFERSLKKVIPGSRWKRVDREDHERFLSDKAELLYVTVNSARIRYMSYLDGDLEGVGSPWKACLKLRQPGDVSFRGAFRTQSKESPGEALRKLKEASDPMLSKMVPTDPTLEEIVGRDLSFHPFLSSQFDNQLNIRLEH